MVAPVGALVEEGAADGEAAVVGSGTSPRKIVQVRAHRRDRARNDTVVVDGCGTVITEVEAVGQAVVGQAVVQPEDEEAGLCGYIANHGRRYDVLPRIQGNEPDVPQAGPAPRIAATDPDAVSACIVGQCTDAR